MRAKSGYNLEDFSLCTLVSLWQAKKSLEAGSANFDLTKPFLSEAEITSILFNLAEVVNFAGQIIIPVVGGKGGKPAAFITTTFLSKNEVFHPVDCDNNEKTSTSDVFKRFVVYPTPNEFHSDTACTLRRCVIMSKLYQYVLAIETFLAQLRPDINGIIANTEASSEYEEIIGPEVVDYKTLTKFIRGSMEIFRSNIQSVQRVKGLPPLDEDTLNRVVHRAGFGMEAICNLAEIISFYQYMLEGPIEHYTCGDTSVFF